MNDSTNMPYVLKSEWAGARINEADLQSFLADLQERRSYWRYLELGMPSWIYTDRLKRDFVLGKILDYGAYILSGIDELPFSTGYYGVGEPFSLHSEKEMPLGEITVDGFCLRTVNMSDVMEGLTQHAAQYETKINPDTAAIESTFKDRNGEKIWFVTEATGKNTRIDVTYKS